jgi:hypothetical protein
MSKPAPHNVHDLNWIMQLEARLSALVREGAANHEGWLAAQTKLEAELADVRKAHDELLRDLLAARDLLHRARRSRALHFFNRRLTAAIVDYFLARLAAKPAEPEKPADPPADPRPNGPAEAAPLP